MTASVNLDASESTKNGSAWAALLSAGIGGVVFGILTDVSECSPAASKFLQRCYPPAGSLSGVAVYTILIWILIWIALHFGWKNRQFQNQALLVGIVCLLVLAAFITTFPPFYEVIGG